MVIAPERERAYAQPRIEVVAPEREQGIVRPRQVVLIPMEV